MEYSLTKGFGFVEIYGFITCQSVSPNALGLVGAQKDRGALPALLALSSTHLL